MQTPYGQGQSGYGNFNTQYNEPEIHIEEI